VSAASGIYGAHKQSEATEDAAKVQKDYNDKALAAAEEQRNYERQQYADRLNRLAPYRNLGVASTATLSNLLARSPYTRMANQGQARVPSYAQSLPGQYVTAPTPLVNALRPVVRPLAYSNSTLSPGNVRQQIQDPREEE
jgi:hypothetical protein